MLGIDLLYPLMWTFFCVIARVGPVLTMMPPIRGSNVPMQIKAILAIGLAASITPLTMETATPMPAALPILAIQIAKELMLGMLLGCVVVVIISGFQLGAQIIASLASLEIAETADPGTRESSSIVSQIFSWLAMGIFLLIGGHRAMLQCCIDTFEFYPAGGVLAEEFWLMHTHELLHHAAGIGLRAAAPAAIALLLANLTTALLGRTLPQLNIMAIGFNINVLVMTWVLFASVGAIGYIFQHELAAWLGETQLFFAQHSESSQQILQSTSGMEGTR